MRTATICKTALAHLSLACLALAAAMPGPAAAQTFPARPVTLVIPFPAGGGTDVYVRVLQPLLAHELKQTVLVENRAGAASRLGTRYVARTAEADGYTVLIGGTSNMSVAPAVSPGTAGYDVFGDFEPVGLLYTAANVIVVTPDVPASNLKELIAYARANPGKLNFGSTGIGSFQHLGLEYLKAEAGGFDIVHVPYKSGGEVATAMAGGQVQMTMSSFAAVLQQVRAGTLKAIATTGTSRPKSFPDVATAIEQGFPNYVMMANFSASVRKGTPPERIEILRAGFRKANASPEIAAFMDKIGANAEVPEADTFTRFYKEDIARFMAAAKAAGIYEAP